MSNISFSKLTWENLPARTTALSATNLNRIEKGIDDSVNGVNSNSHSIAELQTRISQIANGSPTPVATVAEMTDESAVYLYTGSESGYTAGNWYFWNGSAWTSGGTYGGAVTDTTLSISGAPADAKAVGDALATKADSSDVTALDTRVTAVEDDVTALDDRVTVLEAGGSGSGLTNAQKLAILNCFAHVAWTDDQGQTYYDELEDVLFPPAELTRISAVYVNSGVVYPDANIEDLRQYITVTAHFSNSTTTTVNAYTLSGTLTVGTSVLTIAYEGKTTTVSVTVTEEPKSDMDGWSDGVMYTDIDIIENSYYNNHGAITSYNGWNRTGKIPCDGASTLVLKANGSGNIDKTYCWFFAQDGSPLENFASNPSMSTDVTLTVPSTAYYFGISSQASQVSAQLTQGIYPYA